VDASTKPVTSNVLFDHDFDANAHHAATTDTNANTICTGTGNYLDGEGNCDALVTDTGAPHGDGTDAASGFLCLGVDASGNCQLAHVDDTAGGVDASTKPVTSNVLFDHAGLANVHHTPTVDTNANTICAGTDNYLDGEGNCDIISGAAQTGWVVSASTSITAELDSVAFDGLAEDTIYEVVFHGIQNTTSGIFYVVFNQDRTGGDYDYGGTYTSSDGNIGAGDTNINVDQCVWSSTNASNDPIAGSPIIMNPLTIWGTGGEVWARGNVFHQAAGKAIEFRNVCMYEGGALTSIGFTSSAGTLTYTAHLLTFMP